MKNIGKNVYLITLVVLFSISNAFSKQNCDTQISFDLNPLDTFGASYGDVAGDIVFTEMGINVSIDSMLWFNGNRGYNYVQIQNVDCGFGYDQRVWFNNASLIFDLTPIVTDAVSFIYWDMGGDENLQVNGATEHVVSKFENLPSIVAPNVICIVDSVYKDNCSGVEIGKVTLIGKIDELRIAGQELAIDSLCINQIAQVEIPEDLECKKQVSFDLHPLDTFTSANGDNAGDLVFSESGIDVSIDSMLWFNGNRGYNYVQLQVADCGFGFQQRAWCNNASLIFDLNSVKTKAVSFIYWDMGGDENFQVNGATEFVLSTFKALPSIVAPGVKCVVDSVYKDSCYDIEIGRVTLVGDVNELRIAGQELAVDSLCIDEFPPIEIPDSFDCDIQLSFDDQQIDTFGAAFGDNAGDFIFAESGIDVSIDSILWDNGFRGYNSAIIQTADCGFGMGQRAWLNNASLIFDLSSVSAQAVSFIAWDLGGEENLQVNGATEFVVPNFKALPPMVAPGVSCFVDSIYSDNCYSKEVCRVTLYGKISELRIAGQELTIDSICVDERPVVVIPPIDCETQISFDAHPVDSFGAVYGDNAGDIVLTESGIDVRIDSIQWLNGMKGYNLINVEEVNCGFGFDQRVWFSNATFIFDLNNIQTEAVTFIYWDNGGEENLQVNGAMNFVRNSLRTLPIDIAPNVQCVVDSISKDNCYNNEIGRVTLLGNVNELRIGGQEFAIDSVCIDEVPPIAVNEYAYKRSNRLTHNYPNPFSSSTQITYNLTESGWVNITVYDIQGRKVRELINKPQTINQYTLQFDANDLPNGVYFYKFQVNNYVEVQKMFLIK